MDPRVQAVITHINENTHRELSLGHMAKAAGLSTWHLSHLFKAETGLSPIQYLHFTRMEKAKALLESTPLMVKQIMPRVGITDESHFRRNFRKTYGYTPAEWRARSYTRHAAALDFPAPPRPEPQIARTAI